MMAHLTETRVRDPLMLTTAQRAAWLGFGAQFGLALLAGVAARFAGVTAGYAAALFVAGGVPVWLHLLLLLWRERQLTRQSLHRSAPGEPETASPLARAQRRLHNARNRWSTVAGALVAVIHAAAVTFFVPGLRRAIWGAASLQFHPLLGLAVSGGLTVGALFTGLFYRQLSRHEALHDFRAPAAHLAATLAPLGLLTVTFGLAASGQPQYVGLLGRYLPLLSIILAAEILVLLLMDLYRPRRPGVVTRPAYESHLLGLLVERDGLAQTARNALVYQFGIDVTQSRLIRGALRVLQPLVVASVMLLVGLTSVVVVEEGTRGVVTRFGALARPPLEPGLHLKLPWPLEQVERLDTARVRKIHIGSHRVEEGQQTFREGVPLLWTNTHGVNAETLLILSPPEHLLSGVSYAEASRGPALSLAGCDLYVEYRISNAADYIRGHRDTASSFSHMATREAGRMLLSYDVDTLLGPGRGRLSRTLQKSLQALADRERLGLEVLYVGLVAAHPPQTVAEAFHESISAFQKRETEIQEARQERVRVLAQTAGSVQQAEELLALIKQQEDLEEAGGTPEAIDKIGRRIDKLLSASGGQVAERLGRARAGQWTIRNRERGLAERFQRQLQVYEKAPRLVKLDMYFETLVSGIMNARKYVVLGERSDLIFRTTDQEDEEEGKGQ